LRNRHFGGSAQRYEPAVCAKQIEGDRELDCRSDCCIANIQSKVRCRYRKEKCIVFCYFTCGKLNVRGSVFCTIGVLPSVSSALPQLAARYGGVLFTQTARGSFLF